MHDGSNGIPVNKRVRVRDQERCPMASDLKRAMREKAKRGETTFALTADVKEAHRQIPIAEEDWRLLGCRVRPGTFCLHKHGRHVRHLFRLILLVKDWIRRRQFVIGRSAGLITFFVVCSLLGVPFSWPKTSDGDTLTWVGFEMLHRSDWVSQLAERSGSSDGAKKHPELIRLICPLLSRCSAESPTWLGLWSTIERS